MPTPRAMFCILSVTCLLTLAFNYYSGLAHVLPVRCIIPIEMQRFE